MFDIILTNIYKILHRPIGRYYRTLVLACFGSTRKRNEETIGLIKQMHLLSTDNRRNISVFVFVSGLS